jgi:two-component system response regulator RegA
MTHRTGPSLVIVDDDAAFRRTLRRAMERRGFLVTDLPSGCAAEEALDRIRPDAAVFELRLGHGSGLDLTRRLRALRPDARILILTGFGSVESAVAAAKTGVTDFLAKPANAVVIEAVLAARPRHYLTTHTFPNPEEQELNYLLTMFEQHDRNMSETARAIGMHRRTLQRILRRHGIAPSHAVAEDPPSRLKRMKRMVKLWRRLLEGPDYKLPEGAAPAE